MAQNFPRNALGFIASVGVDPQDSDDLRTRKVLLVYMILAGMILLILWASLYLVFGELPAALTLFAHAAVMLVSLSLYSQRRISYYVLRISQRLLALIVPFVLTISLGGFANSSIFIVWALIAPLGTALFGEPLEKFLRWSAVYLLLVFLVGVLQPFLSPATHLPPALVTTLFALNVGGASALVLAMIYYFVSQRNLAFQLLRDEQEKAENLLLNILPREIAAILKSENHIIAEQFGGASILFADVVGFTPLSAKMTPVAIVELLDEIFSHFDSLVEKYNLEKIKTIGDCYMAAAGVPRPQPDHARLLACAALDMRDYVTGRAFNGHRLSLRIGLNSGPVVAGVIGRKKFIYDLWGDAVNTASRMETHAAVGVIQITRNTYDLIKDEFVCEPRGLLSVKGKGEMEVWHVMGMKWKPDLTLPL